MRRLAGSRGQTPRLRRCSPWSSASRRGPQPRPYCARRRGGSNPAVSHPQRQRRRTDRRQWQREVIEDRAARIADLERPDRRREVAAERGVIAGLHLRRHCEQPPDELHVLVVALALLVGKRPDEARMELERRIDERRVHPQQQLRVERAVALPGDPPVYAVHPRRRRLGLLGVAERDRVHRLQRAQQPPEPIPAVRAVLGGAARDERMGDLHQQRAARPEEDDRLPVDGADRRARPERRAARHARGSRCAPRRPRATRHR